MPSGYLTSEAADVAVYYTDTDSGINTASVSVYWTTPDTSLSASCAVYADYASCPQTGLPQGSHNINVSVADNAGNTATGSSTVFIDTLQPTVASGYYPASNAKIGNASPTITLTPTDRLYAGYTDRGAPPVPTWAPPPCCLTAARHPAPTTASLVSCPTSGLAEGVHSWTYNLADNAGNLYSRTRSFTVDLTGPSVTSVTPSGNINVTDADVAVYYTDAASGVNAASVSVYMDGNPITCAAATAQYASCPQSGLLEGAHTVSVSLADNAGNTGTGAGSFFVDTLAPSGSSITPRSNQPVASQQIKAQLRDNTLAGYTGTASQSGVNLATLGVKLDGADVTGCTTVPNATPGRYDMTCPAITMSEGAHHRGVHRRHGRQPRPEHPHLPDRHDRSRGQ